MRGLKDSRRMEDTVGTGDWRIIVDWRTIVDWRIRVDWRVEIGMVKILFEEIFTKDCRRSYGHNFYMMILNTKFKSTRVENLSIFLMA